ncbi:hypothetical protein AB6M97_10325 [Streptococcus hillyeri]|uniref:hypothetical protein n=1 Tax=Streptococcus hillyeri TaxID=2282420 RepID=UPI0034E2D0DA
MTTYYFKVARRQQWPLIEWLFLIGGDGKSTRDRNALQMSTSSQVTQQSPLKRQATQKRQLEV